MAKTELPLPIVPPDMPRTVCGCQLCRVGCRTMPGALIPGDLERIQEYLGEPGDDFVLEHFEASSGAVVCKTVGEQKIVFNVPSIVPAQRPDGRCVFLDEDGGCRIHPVAPFGCSHFDTHLPTEEANRRSQFAVQSQLQDHLRDGSYHALGVRLEEVGRGSCPLDVRRQLYKQEFDRSVRQAIG